LTLNILALNLVPEFQEPTYSRKVRQPRLLDGTGLSFYAIAFGAATQITTNTQLSDRWLPTLPSENLPPFLCPEYPFPALAGRKYPI